MGNLIATGATIVLPLFNYLVVLPYIFYPPRWGIPWYTPNGFVISFIGLLVILVELILIGTLSGVMNTLKKCNKINIKQSIKRSMWIIMGYIIGNIILLTMPFLKTPLLLAGLSVPYGGWWTHGIMTAIPVMYFGAMGITRLLADVC
jgi:hypothetical protein